MAVAKLVDAAFGTYEQEQYGGLVQVPIVHYVGYPIHDRPENISGDDRNYKLAAFLAYAAYDRSVCHSAEQCADTPTYDSYLSRQYTNDY
jgi:hypothetical protein